MARRLRIYGITLSLLNPGKIAHISHGEVTRPETVDSITMRPAPGGLFCPRIFGPTEANRCSCGRYSGTRKRGMVCEDCGVEVGDPKVRKERPGHITLTFPVVHIWFKNIIAVLLGIPPSQLESIIQCKNYIVLRKGAGPHKRKDIISFNEYLQCRTAKGFKAGTGGKAVKHLLGYLDIEALVRELRDTPPSRRVSRRLKIARDFQRSGNNPEWMVPDVLVVLPPGLRPIVTLEDGTIASSDLNDLYMKVITRNNRLKKYDFAGAPEIILNNERRLLQASVDALFDNTRKGAVKDRSGKRALKSLSETLRSKHGRLRRNLLGKRVDYSGRSVIVAGPELTLDQCGIPKEMAMDMFRPFIYGKLLRSGLAASLKHARALVDSRSAEAVGALEKIIKGKTVLLNRAPSLHRMNVQAFYPVLIEGLAIKLHPLACQAFNADFDGDQMGVHIPVSYRAQLEARTLMLSINNIMSPAHGDPVILPAQDIALGVYYLTQEKEGGRGEGMAFADREDVITAYQHGIIEEHSRIRLRLEDRIIDTTPGRVILSGLFPEQLPFELFNRVIRKSDLNVLIGTCHDRFGHDETISLLDRIKDTGFHYATLSGISFGIDDMIVPEEKQEIIAAAEREIKGIEDMLRKGLITGEERHNKIIDLWNRANDIIAEKMVGILGAAEGAHHNSIFMMADSGARGSLLQIRQVAGMRGLMSKPTGEIMEIPVKSSLKEGQTCFEFLIASHGARKGRADGALRTANAGYFTRRLIDAVCDIFISGQDCGTTGGITVTPLYDNNGDEVIPLEDRICGRAAAQDIVHPVSGEIIANRNEILSRSMLDKIKEAGVAKVKVRSPVTCMFSKGICALCYGYDLSRRAPARAGDAAGIIAAQSIGEPGTQLTLRTFHSGGSASGGPVRSSLESKESGRVRFDDIRTVKRTDGKLVVVNRGGSVTLIAGRGEREIGSIPYGAVLHAEDLGTVVSGWKIAEWDPFTVPIISVKGGLVTYSDIIEGLTMKSEEIRETGRSLKVITAVFKDMAPKLIIAGEEYYLPVGAVIIAREGENADAGEVIAKSPKKAAKNADITDGLSRVLQILEARPLRKPALMAGISGRVQVCPPRGKYLPVRITGEDGTSREYVVSIEEQLNVHNGDCVKAGDALVDGVINAGDVLSILGHESAAVHIVNEVQKVYRSQGVTIDDKHIELVTRKMLGMVEVTDPGDTDFVHGEVVGKSVFLEQNGLTGGRKAVAKPVLAGITAVAMNSESWLSAASFQRTASVLTQAAIRRKTDTLAGPKENIIIGNIIPLGTGHPAYREEYLQPFTCAIISEKRKEYVQQSKAGLKQ